MKRLAVVAGIAALASLPLLSSVASAVPTAKQMLGTEPSAGAVGFGQVKPTRLGFDRHVLVCRIHWDSWGGQIALGTGVGWAVNPKTYKRTPSAVVVYLYDLKTVQGAPAYTRLNFEPVPTRHARSVRAY